jgi:hypothetical protein
MTADSKFMTRNYRKKTKSALLDEESEPQRTWTKADDWELCERTLEIREVESAVNARTLSQVQPSAPGGVLSQIQRLLPTHSAQKERCPEFGKTYRKR